MPTPRETIIAALHARLSALPGAVIGWDLTAALALTDALGVPPTAATELLPVIEAVMVWKLNEELGGNAGAGIRP